MLTAKSVDRESPQKLYVQMYAIIKDRIKSREWAAGSQIPTEDELCTAFGVSKATVRMAIAELVRDGYLRKQQGKGTFVTRTHQNAGITMKTKLSEDMFGEGVCVKKELLVRELREPATDVRDALRTDGRVYYILCKRTANGEAAYIEESFIPLYLANGINEQDVCRLPIYEVVQQSTDRKIHKVIQSVEIGAINGNAALILKAAEGTPALLLHRLLVDADGGPLAYTRLMGGGRKYKLQTELIQIPYQER